MSVSVSWNAAFTAHPVQEIPDACVDESVSGGLPYVLLWLSLTHDYSDTVIRS